MDAHGVRLDVITTDDQGRRIDVEMQMRDEKNIPRRMRYYEGSIDQATLEKGQNYNRLGDVVLTHLMHMGITNIRSAIHVRKTRRLYSMMESQRCS